MNKNLTWLAKEKQKDKNEISSHKINTIREILNVDKKEITKGPLKIKKDRKIRLGVVYPESGGTFSIGVNIDSHTSTTGSNSLIHSVVQTGLSLSWSTPILTCIMQPELLGIIRKTH